MVAIRHRFCKRHLGRSDLRLQLRGVGPACAGGARAQ